jgi:HAD superfamily hydrolase (TIGR01509 family)
VRRSRFLDRIAGEGPLPGVADTLARAHELGLRVGLASSSGREWVVGNLERLDLLHHFRCVRTADDVQRVKPEPDLYLSALECLGVEPRHAVAFEDSPNGALAVRRAGMHCVVVPNSVTAGLAFHDGHLRLDSMLQADLPALFERLVRAADAADESAA